MITHLGCDFLLSGFRAESGGFADRPGEWFFTINACAGFKSADGGAVVVVVGATDPDGIEVVVFVKEFAVVGINLHTRLGLLGLFDLTCTTPVRIWFDDGDHVLIEPRTKSGSGPSACSNACEAKFFVGGRATSNVRKGHDRDTGPSAFFNEVTAGVGGLRWCIFHGGFRESYRS